MRFDNGLYLIPMDAMAMAQLINVNQATGAGLDASQPPTTAGEWNAWMRTLTKYDTSGDLSQAGITHRIKSLGIHGEFGQSAYVAEHLYEKHGLTAKKMIEAALTLIDRK